MRSWSMCISCLVAVVTLVVETTGYTSNEVIEAIMKGHMDKRAAIFEDECRMDDKEKQICGRKTYNEMECRARGCCWQLCEGCPAEIPWCFLAKRMQRDTCNVAYEQKDDCGYWGIPEGECYLRGCCYRPSTRTNDPWCFKPGTGVRLVNGPNARSGRVEIMHDNVWGTVCDDNFYNEAAEVVCRSLGHVGGKRYGSAHFGSGTGKIWLDGFRCRGTETRLEDCTNINWGRHDCSHGEDAGVECDPAPGAAPEDDDGSGDGDVSSGDSWLYRAKLI